jgi:sugar lactone lactonase YvrE
MNTKCQSVIRAARHSFGGVVCVAAVLLIASSAQAQNLFEADFWSGNIYEITPNGVVSTFASGVYYPTALTFDGAGNLFVADSHGNINAFTPNGVESVFASGLYNTTGLAFDSAGNLFVATGLPGQVGGFILEYTPSGGRSIFASELDSRGLAFNTGGDLFDAEFGNTSAVLKFTPLGVKSTFASGLNSVTSLAFDSKDNLFVLDGWNILQFTPSGVESTFASGLYYPYAITFDSDDDLFVAEDSTLEIRPDGTQSVFAPISGTRLAFQPVPAPEPTSFELLIVGTVALFVCRMSNGGTKVSPNSSPKVTPDEQ